MNLKIFQSAFIGVVCAAFLGSCGKPEVPRSLLPDNSSEARRLLEGEAIGKGLALYALDHSNRLPSALEELVPNYLGSNVPISRFHLVESSSNSQPSRTIVASERVAANMRKVLIRADGKAYLLYPGQ